ncbi:MAG: TIGR03618 family F420-dependent PPOX class oxidoreductase [Acidimicrobiales bacterium]|nr:TIGR03618 family F420-dependent PPOX class oxidoreductase [Acidimicrobiales bacterium]
MSGAAPETAPTSDPWSSAQRRFAQDHQWAVLATGRRDGSPQQSMVGYLLDDAGRIVISVKSYTAKWHNALRQPRVSLCVTDGRRHLVVVGTVETIDADPLRAELTASVFGRLAGGDPPEPTTLIPLLDEQQRTVLRLTPGRVSMHE